MYAYVFGWHTIKSGTFWSFTGAGWHWWRLVLRWCGAGIGSRHLSVAGTPTPLHLQHVCRFFAVTNWQQKQPSVWYSQPIAVCLWIATFTFLCPGRSTPHWLSSQTSVQGFLIRYWVFSNARQGIPPLAILAISKARHMSECSSCSQSPCLAIVAYMLKTNKTLVAAFKNEISLLPLPYMCQLPSQRYLKPWLSTPGDCHHEICMLKCQSWHPHDIQFGWLRINALVNQECFPL